MYSGPREDLIKDQLRDWLRKMSPAERFEQFVVSQPRALAILTYLLNYLGKDEVAEYLFSQMSPGAGNVADCFYVCIRHGARAKELDKKRDSEERLLLQGLRTVRGGPQPCMALSLELVSQFDRLWDCLQTLSSSLIFAQLERAKFQDRTFSSLEEHLPGSCWFHPKNHQLALHWVVFVLEIQLSYRFCNQQAYFPPLAPEMAGLNSFILKTKDFKAKYLPKELFTLHLPSKAISEMVHYYIQNTSKKDLAQRITETPFRKAGKPT
jgi:hypothetical protein